MVRPAIARRVGPRCCRKDVSTHVHPADGRAERPELPEGPEWVYEVKFDGYRALLLKSGAGIELRSRNNMGLTECVSVGPSRRPASSGPTRWFSTARSLRWTRQDGRPFRRSSIALHTRSTLSSSTRSTCCSWKVKSSPPCSLVTRRAKLEPLVKGSGVLLSETLAGSAAHVIEAVRALGLEGIVAKRKDSRYVPGERNSSWLKLKLHRQQEFVVGGYRSGSNGVDALLVGYYEGGLRFGGKTRGIHAADTPAGIRPTPADAHDAVPVHRPPQQQDVPRGRRGHSRADEPDAVGQTEAGGPGQVRRVDGRGAPANVASSGCAPTSERARFGEKSGE